MNNIKIRYVFRHKDTGNIEVKTYFISQLEERPARQLSPVFCEEFGYELISRDLWTGKKDKNGREIYEGDVVRITNEDDEEEYNICEVKFSGGAFQVDVSGISSDYDLTAIGWVEYATIETVGDVHRNPEMLGGAAE
ncbi:YopX family protein [Bacillus atrophaeus]|uniref:YopX family protein n=1 Tax=Bacillus atrophaeus TaxID=1452 RepID=UPI00077A5430|nr:YopX family protein [Bacillus atrophaeus]KXZ12944.1 hypothetical protein AXI57_17210 [Bacillus atrophaeus]MED4809558.1 YopX family protein [Bacillus atrophaeus]GED04345.1 hypothetical protein BAT02nite_39890 [Bacillus atrophaeus]